MAPCRCAAGAAAFAWPSRAPRRSVLRRLVGELTAHRRRPHPRTIAAAEHDAVGDL